MQTDSPFEKLDDEIVEYIQTTQRAMQLVLQAGASRYGAMSEGESTLSGLWYEDMPMLARAAADAYGIAPALFAGSPCDSQKLRALEEEVRITGEFVAFLETTLQKARGLHNAGRKRLCDWTYGITDQVIGLEGLPFVPLEQRALLESVAPLVHKVLDARAAQKNATRESNKALKAQAEAVSARVGVQLQQKDREIAILRGAPAPMDVTTGSPPPAPKKGRRSRRG